MNDTWFEVSCEVPTELVEVVADRLAELSNNGVCTENRSVDAFSLSEIPETVRTTVKSYLPDEPTAERVLSDLSAFCLSLTERLPQLVISSPVVTPVRTEDWSNSWKSHFKPLRVGERILVVPTWEDVTPEPNDLVLRIDPGMAFGTGGHETTRLCLELVEQVMTAGAGSTALSVLDLGTGSGILAMAASRLGAQRVLAVDIDPEAVEVARENLALNGLLELVECDTLPLESISETFNIILANILAEELVRLAPSLLTCLASGGLLVLSGILAEKEALVRDGFDPLGLEYCETRRAGEWVALMYRKGV